MVGSDAEDCIFAATYCSYQTHRLPVPEGFTPTLSSAQALGFLILPGGFQHSQVLGSSALQQAFGGMGFCFLGSAMCEAFVIC